MDIYEIREKYKNVPLKNIPLRVVYYARVSTEKVEQLNALSNQLTYYENFIKSCPNWQFIRGYVDEGLSGISTAKRENFNQMLEDAHYKKFDLIVTKEISRFARNTLDSIKYTRELLKNGIAVYFREDNINTLDADSELRLTIMASLAQDESRRISNRVRTGHSIAIKKGHVLGNSRIYGYQMCGAKLKIVESEAKMIRRIFELYVTGDYGTRQIENILFDEGYRNTKGGQIRRNVIGRIIANPKYKGFYCGNKVKIIDMFTKQQKYLPPEEWECWKDETGEIVPAIVSEEIWDRANDIFKARSAEVKARSGKQNHHNLFTSKILCGNCGTNYMVKYRTIHGKRQNPTWACSNKLKNGADVCNSFYLKEDDIVVIIRDVIKMTMVKNSEIVNEYLELYRNNLENTNCQAKKNEINQKIKALENKQNCLLDLITDGIIDKETFKNKNDQVTKELSDLKRELMGLDDSERKKEEKIKSIEYLKHYAENLFKENNGNFDNLIITPKIIDSYIKKIIITPYEKYKVKIDIILLGDASISCDYRKDEKISTFTLGNIFKKILTKVNTYKFSKRTAVGREIEMQCIINLFV